MLKNNSNPNAAFAIVLYSRRSAINLDPNDEDVETTANDVICPVSKNVFNPTKKL